MGEPAPQREPQRLIAGAMSGTSADGVDVAIVRVAGRDTGMSVHLLCHRHRPYSTELRNAIFSMRGGEPVRVSELARCSREISLEYSNAVNDALAAAGVHGSDLAAVAAHGQTLYHAPPDTVQMLDPALLAARVGCPVVSDFRRADCAAGGQGAPLVPFADYVLFRHPHKSRVLLNIGGVANLTFIPAGALLEQVVAFDTGPGNCISDHLCRRHEPSGRGYDPDGRRAAGGSVFRGIVDQVLTSPYFAASPPKSTDGPAMIALFERAVTAAGGNFSIETLLATACALTAATIARAVPSADEMFVSGGGVYNRTLMRMLSDEGVRTRPIREAGANFDGAAKEAIAFALLGAATLDGLPSNVPSATGARRPVVLGSITPRP